jgi:hypothetical protein
MKPLLPFSRTQKSQVVMSLHLEQHSASSCASVLPHTRCVATTWPCSSWKLALHGVIFGFPHTRFHPPRLLTLFDGFLAAFFLNQQYVVLTAPCAVVNGMRSRTQNSHNGFLAHKSQQAESMYCSWMICVFIPFPLHTAILSTWAPPLSRKVCLQDGTPAPQPCRNPPRRFTFLDGPPRFLLNQHALGRFLPSPVVEPMASRTQKSQSVSFRHNAQQCASNSAPFLPQTYRICPIWDPPQS